MTLAHINVVIGIVQRLQISEATDYYLRQVNEVNGGDNNQLRSFDVYLSVCLCVCVCAAAGHGS